MSTFLLHLTSVFISNAKSTFWVLKFPEFAQTIATDNSAFLNPYQHGFLNLKPYSQAPKQAQKSNNPLNRK